MAQQIFKDPYVSSLPALLSGAVGNGTLLVDRLTHFTITQTYTATCTAIAPFTTFKIVGSLDGPVGTAVVGTQFIDPDLKVFLTINQGPTAFEVGDQIQFEVTQGTDLNQANIDDYDELPQKNFGPGNVGTNSGDENLRFQATARFAKAILQDLTYTSLLTEEDGNDIKIEYYNTSTPQAAYLTIQDLTFTADSTGSAGNGISMEYLDWIPAVAAEAIVGDVNFTAQTAGSAGNSITVEFVVAPGSISVGVVGTAITVTFPSGTTATAIKNAVNAATALVSAAVTGDGTEAQSAAGPTSLAGGVNAQGDAGNEVVSVVGSAITVRLQSGFSTAAQIKSKLDAHGAASALINTTISGVSGNQQTAPVAQTFLANGSDSVGSPGSEVVTVTGRKIRVGFQSGVNTATNIKAKIDATPAAAALVSVAITGTAGNAQTTDSKFLSGGAPANQFSFNRDELTAVAAFFEGNANLLLNQLIAQSGAYIRGALVAQGIVSLNDLEATANGSGTAFTNLQKALNAFLAYMGSPSEFDSTPSYSTAPVSPVANRFVIDNTSLTRAIKALDTELGDHEDDTQPHGATAAPTAGRIVWRDMNGDTAVHQLLVATGSSGGLDLSNAGSLYIGSSVGANNLYLGGALSTVVIPGNLEVQGTSTTLNTATLDVEDLNITVNKNGTDGSSEGAGLTVDRTGTKGSLIYAAASISRWKAGDLGSEVEVVVVSGVQTLTQKIIAVGSNSITGTASRAAQFSVGGNLEPSAVTTTELGYLSGVTSNVQTQLDSKVAKADYRAGSVALTAGDTSKTITFSSSLGTTSYRVKPILANETDANPQFQPITITGRTATGFTVKWNAPIENNNYALEYIAIKDN